MFHVKQFLLPALLCATAHADEYRPRFLCTPPTVSAAGQLIDPVNDISEYRIYCTPEPQNTPLTVPADGPCDFHPAFGTFTPGVYQCHVTTAFTPALGGGESDVSNQITVTVLPDKPARITDFESQ